MSICLAMEEKALDDNKITARCHSLIRTSSQRSWNSANSSVITTTTNIQENIDNSNNNTNKNNKQSKGRFTENEKKMLFDSIRGDPGLFCAFLHQRKERMYGTKSWMHEITQRYNSKANDKRSLEAIRHHLMYRKGNCSGVKAEKQKEYQFLLKHVKNCDKSDTCTKCLIFLRNCVQSKLIHCGYNRCTECDKRTPLAKDAIMLIKKAPESNLNVAAKKKQNENNLNLFKHHNLKINTATVNSSAPPGFFDGISAANNSSNNGSNSNNNALATLNLMNKFISPDNKNNTTMLFSPENLNYNNPGLNNLQQASAIKGGYPHPSLSPPAKNPIFFPSPNQTALFDNLNLLSAKMNFSPNMKSVSNPVVVPSITNSSKNEAVPTNANSFLTNLEIAAALNKSNGINPSKFVSASNQHQQQQQQNALLEALKEQTKQNLFANSLLVQQQASLSAAQGAGTRHYLEKELSAANIANNMIQMQQQLFQQQQNSNSLKRKMDSSKLDLEIENYVQMTKKAMKR